VCYMKLFRIRTIQIKNKQVISVTKNGNLKGVLREGRGSMDIKQR
jgi:hypothetical protein